MLYSKVMKRLYFRFTIDESNALLMDIYPGNKTLEYIHTLDGKMHYYTRFPGTFPLIAHRTFSCKYYSSSGVVLVRTWNRSIMLGCVTNGMTNMEFKKYILRELREIFYPLILQADQASMEEVMGNFMWNEQTRRFVPVEKQSLATKAWNAWKSFSRRTHD